MTLHQRLRHLLEENAYPGYVYGYPHKKAYRALAAPRQLAEVWAEEPRQQLFCYVHIPFCNQRCSFCNLFTFVPAGQSPTAAYLDALEREMLAYRQALGPCRFQRLYLGGGTPTYLSPAELRRLVGMLRQHLAIDPALTQGCIEASPETLDSEMLDTLRQLGFQRLSLGIQSLVAEELRQVNRRFDFARNHQALEQAGRAGFPQLNVDLIYGLPGQTADRWRVSLDGVIASAATSVFLYPLYIRPLTGLERRAEHLPCPSPREMGLLYDLGRQRLLSAGFRQLTMRQFRRDDPDAQDTEYRCQRDGMVGLGAGARSYTHSLHYSTPWRMRAHNIRAVVEHYVRDQHASRHAVSHGFELDEDEQRRRHVILSLLYDGLDLSLFRRVFGSDARACFEPQWQALRQEGLTLEEGEKLVLSERGVRHADVVGQLFFSGRVERLMAAFEYDP
jgi:oxygen-independent coproporphyrinogen-3 oxidase